MALGWIAMVRPPIPGRHGYADGERSRGVARQTAGGSHAAMSRALLIGFGWCFAGCAVSPTTAQVAPGPCEQTTQFAFVGASTLTALDFRAMERTQDPEESERRGNFWVTEGQVAIPVPTGLPSRSSRMVCVRWTDGNHVGMMASSIEDDWVPPDRR